MLARVLMRGISRPALKKVSQAMKQIIPADSAAKKTEEVATHKTMLKRFYLKVHPDKFAQYPAISESNNESFQKLQSFFEELAEAVKGKRFPVSRAHSLVFYIWTTKGELVESGITIPKAIANKPASQKVMRRLHTLLRTSGGDCKHMVQKTLAELFRKAGINDSWVWEENYWKHHIEKRDAVPEASSTKK